MSKYTFVSIGLLADYINDKREDELKSAIPSHYKNKRNRHFNNITPTEEIK